MARGRTLPTACMAASLLIAAAAYAEEPADTDCRPDAVHVDLEGTLLTRDEKIALLDKALHDSLARFEQCRREGAAGLSQQQGAAGGGGGNGAGGDGAAGTSMESTAASDVRGTEAPVSGATRDGATTADATRPAEPSSVPSSAGVVPSDIPHPNNDSVLEAQIRRAAMEETDPERKAMLWDEYRKYKGLPPAGHE